MIAPKTTVLDKGNLVITSDSPQFLEYCSLQHFTTKNIMQAQSLDQNSLVFSFSDCAAKKTFDLARLTDKKRCVFFPIHVFENTINNALYSLECFLKSDITQALKEQQKALELINCKSPLALTGPSTQSTVNVLSSAVPYAMLDGDLKDNFVHSAAEFFEVHLAHMQPQTACPFTVNGEFRVSGILTVLRKAQSAPPDITNSLTTLIGEVASKQASLKVEGNKVRSFTVDNRDYADLIKRAAGKRGAHLTEFAIGVNQAITPIIDFSINSQMNEGVSGVHVAIGDGTNGYHIDFLCPDVVVLKAVT
ncbi:N-acetylglucosamine-6-phosphate deacetylase [Pseudomonas sp. R4-35-07]|uniref:hypothetical protein n=1 Tax=Pseudomonas sp. R4-35-07 TaxID=658643 RepID=UPI000F5631BB|nr:hypothetical protein [Pseudomonas sp. R4-35-07]AZF33550.1 N-acetylglucosamine-6-phosphate deacetylase [Pseudomonas sp. R4-35-07]